MFATVTLVLMFAFGPLVLAEATRGNSLSPALIWPILALSPVYTLGHIITASTPISMSASFPGASFSCSLLVVFVESWPLLLRASPMLQRRVHATVVNL